MSEIKEDESFIEFPCAFPIKVVGVNIPEFHQRVCAIALKHDETFCEDKISSRQSKTGKYLSLTVTVYATKRPTLDAIYKELTDCELVKWAL